MDFLKTQFEELQKDSNQILAKKVAFTVLGIYLAQKFLVRVIKKSIRNNKLQKMKKQYNDKRLAQIKGHNIPEVDLPENFKQQILNASVCEIKKFLAEKQITSEQLLNLFAKRAFTIGVENNYVTDSNYDDALNLARKYDQMRNEQPDLCQGELFGVVISVKDLFELKNTTCTIGTIINTNMIYKEDGTMVQILKQAGAIIFVKSNLPQLSMSAETLNNVMGPGENPWKKGRNVGGSSGGEGGLIASRCSPLGIGNDIGGSIRIPSAFCGIAGFKPTGGRVQSSGVVPFSDSFQGQKTIPECSGPMAKYVDDLVLTMKALTNQKYIDSIPYRFRSMYEYNIPFDDKKYENNGKKLNIGYYKSVSAFQSPQCFQDTVQNTVDQLKEQGHNMIEIEIPESFEILNAYLDLMFADGGQQFKDMLKYEEPITFYKLLFLNYSVSPKIKKFLGFLAGLFKAPRIKQILNSSKTLNAYEYRNCIAKLDQFKKKIFNIYDEHKLDGLIGPSFGIPAGKHDFLKDIPLCAVYTVIWNAIDSPAGIVPIRLIKENEQLYSDEYNDIITRKTREQMQNSQGLPICVQVISMPHQDEKCLQIMKLVENNARFNEKYPYPI